MKPLKNVEVVLENPNYEDLLNELPVYYFKLCSGFEIQDADFENRNVNVEPVFPNDFDETRIAQFEFDNKLFQLKGAGRVTKEGIEKIDAFGNYETGPPGGVFLEFARKEFERYMEIKDHVKTVNVPLAVIKLPFEFEFKSTKDQDVKKRQLAMILRLVKVEKRIDDVCHEKNPEFDLDLFVKKFGKNIHNLLYKARRTHFALWDGGDVGIDGSIADYDAIHDLNERDLADTIDGCFSTIIRVSKKLNKEPDDYLLEFIKVVCNKNFQKRKLEHIFADAVNFLINDLFGKKVSCLGILSPKFLDRKLYYSTYVIKNDK